MSTKVPNSDDDEEFYEAFDLNSEYVDGQFGEDGEFYYKEKKGKPS